MQWSGAALSTPGAASAVENVGAKQCLSTLGKDQLQAVLEPCGGKAATCEPPRGHSCCLLRGAVHVLRVLLRRGDARLLILRCVATRPERRDVRAQLHAVRRRALSWQPSRNARRLRGHSRWYRWTVVHG